MTTTKKNECKNHVAQRQGVNHRVIDQLVSVISHKNSSVYKLFMRFAACQLNKFETFPFVALSQQIDFHTRYFIAAEGRMHCSDISTFLPSSFDLHIPMTMQLSEWGSRTRAKKLFNTYFANEKLINSKSQFKHISNIEIAKGRRGFGTQRKVNQLIY